MMELGNNWKLLMETEFKLKIFANIKNSKELVIRDENDTGALCSFILSENNIEIQELSWAVSLKVDWQNKTICLKDSEEKNNS